MYEITEQVQYSLTLKNPYTDQVQTMTVLAKRAKETIQTLSEKHPLQKFNLSHLKRAKKSNCPLHISLLIAPTEEAEDLSEYDSLSDECESCPRYTKVLVPSIPPYTKLQLAVWSRLWPCYLIQPSIPPFIHTEEEKKELEKLFSQCKPDCTVLFVPEKEYVVEAGPGKEVWQHSTMMAIEEFKVEGEEYLCTAALAVLYQEPCVMCAMALVHSRVKRVYFREEIENGAYTFHKLHERSLNYMYKIFKYSRIEV